MPKLYFFLLYFQYIDVFFYVFCISYIYYLKEVLVYYFYFYKSPYQLSLYSMWLFLKKKVVSDKVLKKIIHTLLFYYKQLKVIFSIFKIENIKIKYVIFSIFTLLFSNLINQYPSLLVLIPLMIFILFICDYWNQKVSYCNKEHNTFLKMTTLTIIKIKWSILILLCVFTFNVFQI